MNEKALLEINGRMIAFVDEMKSKHKLTQLKTLMYCYESILVGIITCVEYRKEKEIEKFKEDLKQLIDYAFKPDDEEEECEDDEPNLLDCVQMVLEQIKAMQTDRSKSAKKDAN